jgi:hypothetical protein
LARTGICCIVDFEVTATVNMRGEVALKSHLLNTVRQLLLILLKNVTSSFLFVGKTSALSSPGWKKYDVPFFCALRFLEFQIGKVVASATRGQY